MLAAESVWVNSSPSSKRRGHTHTLSTEEPGQESSTLRQTAHIFYPLLPLVTTEKGSGKCVGGSLNLHVYPKDMNRRAGFPKQPHLDHVLNPFIK